MLSVTQGEALRQGGSGLVYSAEEHQHQAARSFYLPVLPVPGAAQLLSVVLESWRPHSLVSSHSNIQRHVKRTFATDRSILTLNHSLTQGLVGPLGFAVCQGSPRHQEWCSPNTPGLHPCGRSGGQGAGQQQCPLRSVSLEPSEA